MAKTIYGKDNSDLDGSTESVTRDISGRSAEYLWHGTHGLDTSVTVTFYGTHENDSDNSDTIELGSMSLSSGGDTDFETMTDPWEKVVIEIAYGATPSSGDITIYESAAR